MSYYFVVIGTRDNPLFEIEFGTSKQGGDGVTRFPAQARELNPFLVHASLDIVEEVMWLNNQMYRSSPYPRFHSVSYYECAKANPSLRYLKRVDHFASAHLSCFLTPTSTKFVLLHLPHAPNQPPPVPDASRNPRLFPPMVPYTTTAPPSSIFATGAAASSGSGGGSGGSASVPTNATGPQTEEALRLFFNEVYEAWVKAFMNPFQGPNKDLASPVFRARVLAAGKKFL